LTRTARYLSPQNGVHIKRKELKIIILVRGTRQVATKHKVNPKSFNLTSKPRSQAKEAVLQNSDALYHCRKFRLSLLVEQIVVEVGDAVAGGGIWGSFQPTNEHGFQLRRGNSRTCPLLLRLGDRPIQPIACR